MNCTQHYCQMITVTQSWGLDGSVVDGMAIGFLIFLTYFLWVRFSVAKNGRKVDMWYMTYLGIHLVIGGACVGWLWP